MPTFCGATYKPVPSTVPPGDPSCTDQTMPASALPATVALNCCRAPVARSAVGGEIDTAICGGAKAAVTEAVPVTVHGPVPVQAPPHPAKALPPDGAAKSDTLPFSAKLAAHTYGQSIPGGADVMRPAPAPPTETSTSNLWTPGPPSRAGPPSGAGGPPSGAGGPPSGSCVPPSWESPPDPDPVVVGIPSLPPQATAT